jgi:hypothetical protein
LKFLPVFQQARIGTSNLKPHEELGLARIPLIPKYVSGRAARVDEPRTLNEMCRLFGRHLFNILLAGCRLSTHLIPRQNGSRGHCELSEPGPVNHDVLCLARSSRSRMQRNSNGLERRSPANVMQSVGIADRGRKIFMNGRLRQVCATCIWLIVEQSHCRRGAAVCWQTPIATVAESTLAMRTVRAAALNVWNRQCRLLRQTHAI